MNATETKAEELKLTALRCKLANLLIAEIPGMAAGEAKALGTAMAAVADTLGFLIGASFTPDTPHYLKALEELGKRVVLASEAVRKQAAKFENAGMSGMKK